MPPWLRRARPSGPAPLVQGQRIPDFPLFTPPTDQRNAPSARGFSKRLLEHRDTAALQTAFFLTIFPRAQVHEVPRRAGFRRPTPPAHIISGAMGPATRPDFSPSPPARLKRCRTGSNAPSARPFMKAFPASTGKLAMPRESPVFAAFSHVDSFPATAKPGRFYFRVAGQTVRFGIKTNPFRRH